MSQEFNEMEHLERQIIKRYNELLKTLLEEGDMDTLERVITDDAYREELILCLISQIISDSYCNQSLSLLRCSIIPSI